MAVEGERCHRPWPGVHSPAAEEARDGALPVIEDGSELPAHDDRVREPAERPEW